MNFKFFIYKKPKSIFYSGARLNTWQINSTGKHRKIDREKVRKGKYLKLFDKVSWARVRIENLIP